MEVEPDINEIKEEKPEGQGEGADSRCLTPEKEEVKEENWVVLEVELTKPKPKR